MNREAVWWEGDAVGYIDQRLLPHTLVARRATSVDHVIDAIKTLAVRGAPAIGIVGAYGVALARSLLADDAAALDDALTVEYVMIGSDLTGDDLLAEP